MHKQPSEEFCKKKLFLKVLQSSLANTSVGASGWSLFLTKLQVIVFSSEFCKSLKNICFEEHMLTAGPDLLNIDYKALPHACYIMRRITNSLSFVWSYDHRLYWHLTTDKHILHGNNVKCKISSKGNAQ